MTRHSWTETLDGWMFGRYQIELAAPSLWVLSRRSRRHGDIGPSESTIVRTGGSLQQLKGVAEELHLRTMTKTRVLWYTVSTFVFVGIAAMGMAAGWPIAVLALALSFASALRALVIWVDYATGRAWAMVSAQYQ